MSGQTRELFNSYGIRRDDLTPIKAHGQNTCALLHGFVAAKYVWLTRQPEFVQHFLDPLKLAWVTKL